MSEVEIFGRFYGQEICTQPRDFAPVDWFKVAESIGVLVEYDDLPGGRWGEYHAEHHLILLDRSLDDVETRCTLVHEIAHAVHRDSPSGLGLFDLRQELLANKLTAAWLVGPFAHGLQADGYPHEELRVTPEVWETYVQQFANKNIEPFCRCGAPNEEQFAIPGGPPRNSCRNERGRATYIELATGEHMSFIDYLAGWYGDGSKLHITSFTGNEPHTFAQIDRERGALWRIRPQPTDCPRCRAEGRYRP